MNTIYRTALAVLLGILCLANSHIASALDVGDFAPCVVLDGINAKGETHTGCIRDRISPSHTHTIIDFFSVHCSTCKENLPALQSLTKLLSDRATLRLVSIDRKVDDIKAFLADPEFNQFIANPVAFDLRQNAMKTYGVTSTPTLFILNKQNHIVYRHQNALTAEDVEHIQELVGQGAQ